MRLKRITYIIVCLSSFALTGCGTASYYAQAVAGQWSLVNAQEPIDELLASATTAPALRTSLARVETIRQFAQETLALPVGETYSGYVDLERDYVVWNVLAAPTDSLELKNWCYPIVGCQNYRGYFDQDQARALALDLDSAGWDTWTPGVPAYSSLGWFEDPVMNTFLFWPEDQLAALIFHELSHKMVYIRGDTTFNESYATAVELEGLLRYLENQDRGDSFTGALARQRMEREFTRLVMSAAEELRELYAQTGMGTQELSQKKALVFAVLRERYELLRQTWPNPNAYRSFFDAGLNNARIASVGTYNRWVPAFRQILTENGGDFGRFHKQVLELSVLAKEEREQRLNALSRRFTEGQVIPPQLHSTAE